MLVEQRGLVYSLKLRLGSTIATGVVAATGIAAAVVTSSIAAAVVTTVIAAVIAAVVVVTTVIATIAVTTVVAVVAAARRSSGLWINRHRCRRLSGIGRIVATGG